MTAKNPTCAHCGFPQSLHVIANYQDIEPQLICPTSLFATTKATVTPEPRSLPIEPVEPVEKVS